MDRGFEAMIPKEQKEAEEPDSLYDYGIKFSLLGKRFSFIIKVQDTRRSS